MVVNDLVTSMSAQGLPASGSVGSGAWALGDGVGGDIVVEAGAVARLLVTDVEGARDINIVPAYKFMMNHQFRDTAQNIVALLPSVAILLVLAPSQTRLLAHRARSSSKLPIPPYPHINL